MFETEDSNTPGCIFQLGNLPESVTSEMQKGLISLDVLELLWDFEMQVKKRVEAQKELDTGCGWFVDCDGFVSAI